MVEFLSKPWPWYICGPIIGLFVPLSYILLSKPFGISKSWRHICAMCLPNTSIKFFQYDWTTGAWNIIFALGIILGGIIASIFFPNPEVVEISERTAQALTSQGINDLTGIVPTEIFSWEKLLTPVSFILIVIGGLFVGFGTRYAGGCTSGHAITGLSQLELPSLIAVFGFFAGGLLSTWVLLPLILKLL